MKSRRLSLNREPTANPAEGVCLFDPTTGTSMGRNSR